MADTIFDELKNLDYSSYNSSKEFANFFIDKKALPEVPVTGFQYVFFTAPELGLTRARFDTKASKSNVASLIENNGNELKLPGYSESIYTENMCKMLAGESGTFMRLFTNRCKSLPASKEVLDTLEMAETWNKFKIPIATTTRDSKVGGNFELLFHECDKLLITKCIKLWIDYMEGVMLGRVISPYAVYSSLDDTQAAVNESQISCYTFSLRPDGKTIQHWSKYTGVFPTSIPYDVFGGEDGDIRAITSIGVDWSFAYKEDMDIQILRDFNLLGQTDKNAILQPSGQFHDHTNVKLPKIDTYPGIAKIVDKTTGNITYELRITDDSNTQGLTKNF